MRTIIIKIVEIVLKALGVAIAAAAILGIANAITQLISLK